MERRTERRVPNPVEAAVPKGSSACCFDDSCRVARVPQSETKSPQPNSRFTMPPFSFFTAHALYLTLHDSKSLARAFPFIELSHAIPRLPYNFSDTPKCYLSVMLKNMGSSMNVRRSYRVLSTCI